MHLVPSATSPASFFAALPPDVVPCCAQQLVVVPWGELGAGLRMPSGHVLSCPATEVKVVDSVGAGDTFIAALLYGVMRRRREREGQSAEPWTWELELCERLLRFACAIAGEKVHVRGIDLPPAVIDRHIRALWGEPPPPQ